MYYTQNLAFVNFVVRSSLNEKEVYLILIYPVDDLPLQVEFADARTPSRRLPHIGREVAHTGDGCSLPPEELLRDAHHVSNEGEVGGGIHPHRG